MACPPIVLANFLLYSGLQATTVGIASRMNTLQNHENRAYEG